jgi:hypothetical protein
MLTTTCPDTGYWRAWLDDPDPAADGHLQSCAACQTQVESLRTNASHAASALEVLAAPAPPSLLATAAARQRLAEHARRPVSRGLTVRTTFRRRGRRFGLGNLSTGWRVAASGLAAAVVLTVGLVVSPEGRALASQFLAQFRSQQVTPITVSPQSQAEIQRTLTQLSNFGLVRTPSYVRSGRTDASSTTVGSLAEASQRVGFALKTPDPASLPAGLSASPRIQVIPADELRFTFDPAKARAYFQSTGHPEVSVPDRFDGTTLVVSMPAAALLLYGGDASHQALVIGQAGELAVGVESPRNVSLEELRDFLLGLPGLPAETVAQLRSINDWRTTLPIPIPTDKVHWQSASFGGHPGLLLNDNSSVASAAVWQADGHLYGLAGSLKATDLQRVAASLR